MRQKPQSKTAEEKTPRKEKGNRAKKSPQQKESPVYEVTLPDCAGLHATPHVQPDGASHLVKGTAYAARKLVRLFSNPEAPQRVRPFLWRRFYGTGADREYGYRAAFAIIDEMIAAADKVRPRRPTQKMRRTAAFRQGYFEALAFAHRFSALGEYPLQEENAGLIQAAMNKAAARRMAQQEQSC